MNVVSRKHLRVRKMRALRPDHTRSTESRRRTRARRLVRRLKGRAA